MKNFGYWLFGADMNKVNLETLKKNGVTDIFLNYYAFTAHGESKVTSWIKKAKTNNINVHIWVQCFYDGSWHNPKTTNLDAKLKEIKKYAGITNVKGIHLDYLRYPGTAYKTSGGADAITNFVKKVRAQNPKVFLSCAVMPETECKKYYGQDIEALAKIVDAVIPMQYKGNYKGGTDWLKSTTKFFSGKAKIWSGLQSYKSDDNPVKLSSNELLTDAKTCLNNGAQGVILFRYGLSEDVNFTNLNGESMTQTHSYTTILTKAKNIKNNVEKNKELGESALWGYYIAKSIINPKKAINRLSFHNAPKPSGHSMNTKMYKEDYIKAAKHLISFVENPKNKRLSNFIPWNGKNIRTRDYVYMFARILVFYDANKQLPNYAAINTGVWTKKSTPTKTNNNSSSTKNNCTNPYTSSPHYTNQGAGALGQITPYDCGPHCIHQGLKKFGVTNISESELMAYCGTTTSGTSHEGINTGIAKAAKKAGIKIKVEWKNFSDLGKTEAERFKALGELICKKNVFAFCHLWYSCAGECIDDDDACGHYEAADKVNIKTGYIRALNSLGARQGNGYYGHLQDRKFSIQSHYIAGISQKSICIMTKV